MKRLTKGLSFNVTLSDEQINQIAEITADKVDYTTRANNKGDVWYEQEIQMLKKQIESRNRIIVKKEILLERVKESNKRRKDILKKYKEKYGEID